MTAAAAEKNQVAAVDESKQQPEQICRNEPIVGSRFVERICATPEQWEQIDKNTEQQMDMMRKSNRAQSACSGARCR